MTLRQAYHAILKGAIVVDGKGVPIYYQFVPQNYPDIYILIQSITSTGRESKCDQDRDVSIQFTVSTRYELNDSMNCDYVAGKIMELCYPNRASVIPGCLSMELVSDVSFGDFDPAGKKQIAERTIIFKHIIQN